MKFGNNFLINSQLYFTQTISVFKKDDQSLLWCKKFIYVIQLSLFNSSSNA